MPNPRISNQKINTEPDGGIKPCAAHSGRYTSTLAKKMNKDESLMQMISAAATIRAIEIVNGKSLTAEQMNSYIQHYNGKYSKKVVQAGFGLLGTMRKSIKKSFGEKISSLFQKEKGNEKIGGMVEQTAQMILSSPASQQKLRTLIENDFRP